MNTLDLLSALPPFRDWSPANILASPAWTMPCRLGSEEGRLVSEGALLPADPLCLSIRFADTPATLALADSPLFPELHALWQSRADVPAPILLALVEKECGPLLQLLENAAGRQLAIDGLETPAAAAAGATGEGQSPSPNPTSAGLRPFALLRSSGEPLCSFTLTLPPAVLESFGALRNLDVSHSSIREVALPAVVQIDTPVLSAADLDSLAPGDHLLLPEVQAPASGGAEGGESPVDWSCSNAMLLVAGLLAASTDGIVPWSDSGALRIILSDPATIPFGELADLSSGSVDYASLVTRHSSLREGTALTLLRGPATLATGRLGAVASQPSFEIETVSLQS